MSRGSKVASSKSKRPIETAHDRDRIIVRLPDGMRDKLAAFAEANGRSMTAEVVAAIEQHLEGGTRIQQLWEFFDRHRQSIETIPLIGAAVENLEIYAERAGEVEFQGGLRALRQHKEREAREAARPPITADQAKKIRALIKETGADETKLLKAMKASSIEDIRNFDRVVGLLELRLRPL
jgi:hypothetical protein